MKIYVAVVEHGDYPDCRETDNLYVGIEEMEARDVIKECNYKHIARRWIEIWSDGILMNVIDLD